MSETKSKTKLGLSAQIFIALFLGSVVGLFLHFFLREGFVRDSVIVDGVLYFVGQGFIRLLQMLVAPLVFSSIVCGTFAIGDTRTLGKVGVKIFLFYLATTVIAISTALGVANLFNPGVGITLSQEEGVSINLSEDTNVVSTLLNMIPRNPFEALAEGNMMQIIFYAVFLGLVLAKIASRVPVVVSFFEQFNETVLELTNFVMFFAPFGVFALICRTFTSIGFSAFLPMLKYMFCVVLALIVQCFVVYPSMLSFFTRLNPLRFFKKFFPVMTFAFTTSVSAAVVPFNIETMVKKIGVSRKLTSFTIPLGATINMDGTAIMQGVAVVFISQIYDMPLTLANLLTVIFMTTVASIGTAGLPSIGLITLTMILISVGLPTEGIALIMGVDRILDMLRTAVNVTGDAVCTLIVAKQNDEFDSEIFAQN